MAQQITMQEYKHATRGIGMKCSELISKLSEIISKEGDIEIKITRIPNETTLLPMDIHEIVVSIDHSANDIKLDIQVKDRY